MVRDESNFALVCGLLAAMVVVENSVLLSASKECERESRLYDLDKVRKTDGGNLTTR